MVARPWAERPECWAVRNCGPFFNSFSAISSPIVQTRSAIPSALAGHAAQSFCATDQRSCGFEFVMREDRKCANV